MKAVFKSMDDRLKQLIVPLLLGILCLSFLIITIVNAAGLSALDSELQTEYLLLDSKNAQINALMKLAKDETKTQQMLEYYRQLLTNGVNQNEIFTRIQELSQEYSVSVSQISFRSVQPVELLKKLPLEITVSGSYPQVMAMLEEFSHGTRLTTLESMSLSAQNTEGHSVQAYVKASLFFE